MVVAMQVPGYEDRKVPFQIGAMWPASQLLARSRERKRPFEQWMACSNDRSGEATVKPEGGVLCASRAPSPSTALMEGWTSRVELGAKCLRGDQKTD